MVDASAKVSCGRLVGECGFRRERVLREAALQREVVAVHLVSGLGTGSPLSPTSSTTPAMSEPSVRRAGNRSPPIRAYAGDPRRHSQSLRLTDVAATFDPHLAGGGRRHRDVLDAQHVGRPVPVVDDRLHSRPAAHLVMAANLEQRNALANVTAFRAE